MGSGGATQLSFADLEEARAPAWDPAASPVDEVPLRETTFVVVDLETTGGRAKSADGTPPDAITEIGAVKVRGGVVLGEFATLVDPQRDIPPQIVRLTGITTAMVCDAPTIDAVLPMFLEFAGGAVLVAHNAGFDIGFLRAAAQRCEIPWPRPPVLCTVRLARRVLSREEAPSVRLAALARLFAVAAEPTHRALDDARATVDVLHALIERVGNQGVHTYADLRSYLPNVTPAQRRKRVLVDGLPHRPGVYLFRGPAGEVLYVGTAVDLRRRVSQYFTGADPRGRMKEMVTLASAVDHVECAHSLEAGVRELRLLAAHAPPYNRRSRFPQRWWWLALTDEAFPRLSVVRAPRHDRAVGPFRSRTDAADTAALLARFTGVRTCTARLGRSALHGPACPERGSFAVPGRPRRDGHPVRGGRGARRGVDRRAGQRRAGRRRGSGQHARRTTSLRERSATARPHRHRRRDAVARPAAARAGRAARADRRQSRTAPMVGMATSSPSSGTANSPRPAPPDAGCRRCRWSTPLALAHRRSCAWRPRSAARWSRRPPSSRAGWPPPGCASSASPRERMGLTAAVGRRLGGLGGRGALGAAGRRTGRSRLGLRPAGRTAPIARATLRPHRSRWPRRHAATRPPTPAAIQRGWIGRHARRSPRRR